MLKNMTRKGEKPLQQLIRRLGEAEQVGHLKKKPEKKASENYPKFSRPHCNGPLKSNLTGTQYTCCTLASGLTINCASDANKCCILNDNSIVLINNFAYSVSTQSMVAVGRKFSVTGNLYSKPFESSLIGLHYVEKLGKNSNAVLLDGIRRRPMPNCTRELANRRQEVMFLASMGRRYSGPAGMGQDLVAANFQYVRGKLKMAEDLSATDLATDYDSGRRRPSEKSKPPASPPPFPKTKLVKADNNKHGRSSAKSSKSSSGVQSESFGNVKDTDLIPFKIFKGDSGCLPKAKLVKADHNKLGRSSARSSSGVQSESGCSSSQTPDHSRLNSVAVMVPGSAKNREQSPKTAVLSTRCFNVNSIKGSFKSFGNVEDTDLINFKRSKGDSGCSPLCISYLSVRDRDVKYFQQLHSAFIS
ncbi:putative pectin lyase F-1 [Frankliniella fusca]|uniref:Pectin lyase F-1 n=1 Tax=Frankliniella fusca TaxID=407009 RepID=A0AAE1H3M5_9NEOP|nr:putative pectin lyase F-1 [Frankliniella fusca]